MFFIVDCFIIIIISSFCLLKKHVLTYYVLWCNVLYCTVMYIYIYTRSDDLGLVPLWWHTILCTKSYACM